MGNYVGDVIAALHDELPDLNVDLTRFYALLVLTRGVNTSLEDVHDAWAVWRDSSNPAHKSLVPFGDLTVEVQELDRKYCDAIVRVAEQVWS